MKKTEIKLTSDELAEIVELNNEYQGTLIDFGQLHLKKVHLEKELQSISELEQKYYSAYAELEKQEKNFKERITRKYGNGEINMDTGIYIRNQNNS